MNDNLFVIHIRGDLAYLGKSDYKTMLNKIEMDYLRTKCIRKIVGVVDIFVERDVEIGEVNFGLVVEADKILESFGGLEVLLAECPASRSREDNIISLISDSLEYGGLLGFVIPVTDALKAIKFEYNDFEDYWITPYSTDRLNITYHEFEEFHKCVDGLNKLMAQIQKRNPQANYYLSNDTMNLMAGTTHDENESPQRQNVTTHALLSSSGGGDW